MLQVQAFLAKIMLAINTTQKCLKIMSAPAIFLKALTHHIMTLDPKTLSIYVQ